MRYILKTTVILSAIAGLIAGILLLIPLLTPILFFLLFTIFGTLIIIYLKRNNLAGFLSAQDGALIGAVSGCISLATAAVVYLPLIFVTGLIFNKTTRIFGFSDSFSDIGYNIFFATMMIFFTSLLSALFNAFSGMITAYIYEKIEGKPFDYHMQVDIDQND